MQLNSLTISLSSRLQTKQYVYLMLNDITTLKPSPISLKTGQIMRYVVFLALAKFASAVGASGTGLRAMIRV